MPESEVAEDAEAEATKRKVRQRTSSKAKQSVQKTTLFSVLPGATRTLRRAEDLRLQREAAMRGEDYEVKGLNMASFSSEATERLAK